MEPTSVGTCERTCRPRRSRRGEDAEAWRGRCSGPEEPRGLFQLPWAPLGKPPESNEYSNIASPQA
eukprot:736396-Pyramimonas_sp.AAC.1